MPRASKPFLQRAAAPLPFKDAAKGYLQADFKDAFRRYMPKAEIEDFLASRADPRPKTRQLL